jgi:hypothetical protein
MKLKNTLHILAILIALSLLNTPTLVNAQELSIGHAPTVDYLSLQPGEEYSETITFWNLSNIETEYSVVVRGFKQVENYPGTSIILTEEEDTRDPYSASKWITTEKKTITLTPNQYVKLNYTVKVPENAANGEHHAKIFLLSSINREEDNLGRTQAFADLGAGPALLINVGDNLIEDAELLEFSTDNWFYELPPVTFNTRFGNLGNTHITPKGDIVISNLLGQELERITFNENNQSLIRGNTASYEDLWDHDGVFLHNNTLAIGPLNAKLITTYKATNPGFAPLSATVTFWVVPWKHILAIGIGVYILYKLIFRKAKQQKEKEERENIVGNASEDAVTLPNNYVS